MEKGFFGSLFDFSFSEFVTPKIISVLYIIGVVVAGIASLILVIGSFRSGVGTGILSLLLMPLYFLLMVIFARVYMEIIIILFKIHEGISSLKK